MLWMTFLKSARSLSTGDNKALDSFESIRGRSLVRSSSCFSVVYVSRLFETTMSWTSAETAVMASEMSFRPILVSLDKVLTPVLISVRAVEDLASLSSKARRRSAAARWPASLITFSQVRQV